MIKNNIKILAIDDHPDNLISLKALLKDIFPEAIIVTTTDGKTGIELATKHDPDVVLLDIIMPGMDGYEVCNQFKHDKVLSDIPVVFITAAGSDRKTRIRAMESGAEAFISKPIDEIELKAQINAMIKIKQANVSKRIEHESLTSLIAERTLLLEKELSRRKMAEQKLQHIVQHYQALIEKAPDGIVLINAEGNFKFVSPSARKIFGYSETEIINGNPAELTHPDDLPLVTSNLEKLMRDPSFFPILQYRFKDKSGNWIWVESIFSNMLEDVNIEAIVINFRDISERINAERETRKSYDLLNNLTSMVPGVVYQYRLFPDGHSCFPYSSPGMWDIYEVTPEEVREDAAPIFTRIHPDDYNYILETIAESVKNQTIYHSEFRVILPSQGLRWRLCDAKPERLEDGSTLWHGIITDITDRKQTTDALLESETRLKEAQRMAHIGSWELDFVNNRLTWSDEIYRLFEIEPGSFGASYEAFLNTIHPDDREAVDQAFSNSLKSKTPYSIDHRIRFDDGRIKYVHEQCETLFNEEGRPLRSMGTVQDFTDRKLADAALRESEVRFREMADTAPMMIWVSDHDKSCTYFNKSWLKFTGRKLEQELGNGWSESLHPDDYHRCLDIYSSSFNQHDPFQMEYRLLRYDGEYRWLVDKGVPRFTSTGEFMGYIGSCLDITDRKLAEDKLRSTSLYARSLIEASLDPLVTISPDGKITDVNHATEMDTGVGRDQLIGSDFCDYFTEPEKARTGYQQVLTQGFVRDYPLTIKHVTGKQTDVLYNATVYKNEAGEIQGVFAAARDITERKRTEQALFEQQQVFRTLVENSPDIIARYNHDCRRTFVNPSYLKVAGIPKEELLASSPLQQSPLPSESAVILNDLLRKVLDSGIADRADVIWPKADGETSWFNIFASPEFDRDGQVVSVMTVSRDITQRKQAEMEIRKLNQELEKRVADRTQKLESLIKELESFTYSVSHDLRAPLRGIHGFTQILMNEYAVNLDNEGKRICGIIKDSSSKMGRLIDDLLAFSKLNRTNMVVADVDMQKMVKSMYYEVTDENTRKRIEINIGNICNSPADINMIKQVWINLLSNAIKFSSKREKSIISVSCKAEKGKCVYCIKDNGAGFDMNYANKMFGVFQRLHSEKDFEGTGVGLAIVQNIIHRHGGEVWAESEIDKGASFYFSLPYFESDNTKATPELTI
jgi:PAS domain S-box-containing protein